MFLGGILLRWMARIGGVRQNTIADMTLYITAWGFAANVLIDNAWVRLFVAVLVITQLVRFVDNVVLVEVPGESQEDTISRAYYLIDLGMAMVEDRPKEQALIRGFLNASTEERIEFLRSLEQLTSESARPHQR